MKKIYITKIRRYVTSLTATNKNRYAKYLENIKWNNFKEIQKWAKKNNFESFRKDRRLFLIKKNEIIVYFKKRDVKR